MTKKRVERRNIALPFFIVLAMLIVVSIPAVSEAVYAETVMEPPTSNTYIDGSELADADMSYGLTTGKIARAVYFGTNGESGLYGNPVQKQKWWIAGYDESGLVLMCDPKQPLKASQLFSSSAQPKEFDSAYGNYANPHSNPVYPSHYGASELRSVLKGLATDESYFTQAEQAIMKETTVYTYDLANDTTYSTTDKLYLAAGCYNKSEITVGQNTIDNDKSGNEKVDNGLKIGLNDKGPYGNPFKDSESCHFWSRSPSDYEFNSNYALWVDPSNRVCEGLIDGTFNTTKEAVVPAFALDSGNVLFASAAEAGKESAAIDGVLTMTFRCDGADRIGSTVTFTNHSVSVDYDDTDPELYLYVQGSEQGEYWFSCDEWVSSQRIDGSVDIPASAIRSGANLTNCKVWLETVEDNIAYAKPAQFTGAFPPPLHGIMTPPAGKKYTYTGKLIHGVRSTVGYHVSGPGRGTSVGIYICDVVLDDGYLWSDGTTDPKTITWQILQAPNPMKLKTKTATVKKSAVKKKAQKLARSKVLTFTKSAKGKVTYTKISGSKKLSIAKTTGTITVKKKTKKGTYKIKVKVTAAGNDSYKALTKTVTLKVRVK